MDDLTKEQRRRNMRNIKAKNTKPEVKVRQFLFSKGLRFRIHDKRYPGCPDIVLPKYNSIVFVNGCFWHQHKGCRYSVIPVSNTEYWEPKLKRNAERDAENRRRLDEMGWRVFVVWECQLKRDMIEETLDNLYRSIVMEGI